MEVRFRRKSCRNTAIVAKISRLRRAIPTNDILVNYSIVFGLKSPRSGEIFFGGKIAAKRRKSYPSSKVKKTLRGTAISYQHLDSPGSVRILSRGSIPRTECSCVTAQLSHTGISIAQSQWEYGRENRSRRRGVPAGCVISYLLPASR